MIKKYPYQNVPLDISDDFFNSAEVEVLGNTMIYEVIEEAAKEFLRGHQIYAQIIDAEMLTKDFFNRI